MSEFSALLLNKEEGRRKNLVLSEFSALLSYSQLYNKYSTGFDINHRIESKP
ncbi:MAG: hypothetical protein F6K01_13340 [Okeania sp. SIO1I7]|nr:hypothetical protein [Okeania sp. SIO1I7]